MRYAFTSADNVAFDLFGTGDDNYIQQRAQAHASLHLFENRLRAFVQLQNTRSWNQELPAPRDESRNDVAQAFWASCKPAPASAVRRSPMVRAP